MDSEFSDTKKTFDKSQWRQKKYSHKTKVQQFEERRRKAALHKYYKELKKSQVDVSHRKQESSVSGGDSKKLHRESNPYEKAKQELERRKKEKELLIAERAKEKVEREDALQKYKKDKIRKYMKLKKKTKKGQPVMAGRMELLLEKIQKNIGTWIWYVCV